MAMASLSGLDLAHRNITEAVAKGCELQYVVDRFNSEAPIAGHGKTTLAQMEAFLRREHAFKGPRLQTLIAISKTLRPKGNSDQHSAAIYTNHIRNRLFDIENVRINRDDLSDMYSHIRGPYSCFYKAYERREKSNYLEVVRYDINRCQRKTGYISGNYTTLRMAEKRLSPSEFLLILAPNRGSLLSVEHTNVLSVFHYDDREDKTIIYTLVRPIRTSLNRCFLYGITVREDRDLHNVVAYKVLWVPEDREEVDSSKFAPVDRILHDDDLDENSMLFLKKMFAYGEPAGNNLYLEIGLDKTRVLRALVEEYIAERKGFPLIRLKSYP